MLHVWFTLDVYQGRRFGHISAKKGFCLGVCIAHLSVIAFAIACRSHLEVVGKALFLLTGDHSKLCHKYVTMSVVIKLNVFDFKATIQTNKSNKRDLKLKQWSNEHFAASLLLF